MPSDPSRRDALRLGGAGLVSLASLAGCLADSDAGSPETTATGTSTETSEPYETTETPTATETGPETFDATMKSVDVTPELVAPNSPDSIGTYGERGEQYVLARYSSDGTRTPDWSDFSLVAGRTSFEPAGPERTFYGYSIWTDEGGYTRIADGYLVFSIPKPLDADEVAVRWPGGEHALDADAVDRLNRPPADFAVREFSAPESVGSGEEVTAKLVVENTGDVAGTFVGALNRIGPMVAYAPVEAVTLDLAAGDTTTWTRTFTPSLGSSDDSRSMTLRLNWRDGDESVSVVVERHESDGSETRTAEREGS